MVIEFFYIDDCPNHAPALELLKELMAVCDVAVPIKLVKVSTTEEARKVKFMGSPSIRIDGVDIEGNGKTTGGDFSLKCRVYKYNWVFQGVPPKKLLREAIETAKNV
ncbi:MAG: DUF2703 domain-containing protein [Nitrospina sp.]|nr:MAG: DUF2703 domain-containing protein [Nitrospina sp.]